MKTKLLKNIASCSLFACALVSLIVATATGQDTPSARIQGTWDGQVTVTNCAGTVLSSFPSMLTFHQEGTLMDASPGLATPGQGVWRHVTGDTYAYHFKKFTFDSSGALTGWRIIDIPQGSLDASGNTLTDSGKVYVYNASGVLVSTPCASGVHKRFGF
jgi:hypothetical protein